MSERKIVACRTREQARARIVLERDGYTVESPRVCDDTTAWDATDAHGANDIRDDAWLIEGEKT